MKGPKEYYNAEVVLARLEKMIEEGRTRRIDVVYNDVSIFDWWPERLNLTHMKQMRSFLREAIKLGYKGYVCFKVGASGCANGMWAYKAQGKVSDDGWVYSPNGDAIYRSFTPDYTYYAANYQGKWFPGEDSDGNKYDSCKTQKQLETLIASL